MHILEYIQIPLEVASFLHFVHSCSCFLTHSTMICYNLLLQSLTCGFVGCGRYSNKHSVAHFEKTRHPYSLELATLRIWDYRHGEYGGFVQRADLLECPSSPPLLYPWLTRGLDLDNPRDSLSTRDLSNQSNQSGSAYGSNANTKIFNRC